MESYFTAISLINDYYNTLYAAIYIIYFFATVIHYYIMLMHEEDSAKTHYTLKNRYKKLMTIAGYSLELGKNHYIGML